MSISSWARDHTFYLLLPAGDCAESSRPTAAAGESDATPWSSSHCSGLPAPSPLSRHISPATLLKVLVVIIFYKINATQNF